MLTIVTGPVGSGKSLWCLHRLIWFLRRSPSHVVTTLSVNVANLQDYCHASFPSEDIDVAGRVGVIPAELLPVFWEVRGVLPDRSLERVPPWGEGWQIVRPVTYILDESQTVFGSRDWAVTHSRSQGALVKYLTQQRKAGDNVFAVTPHASLLDKQFRSLSSEMVMLTNLGKLYVRGFKGPAGLIRYRVFQNCPPGPGEPALSSGSIRVDPARLAGCYDTAAGLGISGVDADKKEVRRGLPWWIVPLVVICLAFSSWFLLRMVFHRMVARAASSVPTSSLSGGVVPAPVRVGPRQRVDTNIDGTNSSYSSNGIRSSLSVKSDTPVKEPTVAGWATGRSSVSGKWVQLVFTDGSTTSGVDVQEVPGGLIVDGVFRPLAPPVPVKH